MSFGHGGIDCGLEGFCEFLVLRRGRCTHQRKEYDGIDESRH
jgi:hypothetical protein